MIAGTTATHANQGSLWNHHTLAAQGVGLPGRPEEVPSCLLSQKEAVAYTTSQIPNIYESL